MTPEKRVQNEIIKYLKELQNQNLPVFYERRQAGGFSYKNGIADIYAVINGLHIEIEVKSKTGHQSIMQEKFQQKCERINIPYLLVNDIEDFKKAIQIYLI